MSKSKVLVFFSKSDIGEKRPRNCPCGCGESIVDTYGIRSEYDYAYSVKPKHIVNKIVEMTK